MANLLYRSSSSPTTPASTTVKNAPLTNLEIDGNFKSVDNDLANKPTLTGTGATGTWGISVTGNAGTVTNGVYTTGSYANPTWITSLAGSKVTDAVLTTGSYANPTWITSLAETKVLPTQTGNTNEMLVTNGTSTGWSEGLTYSAGTLTTTNFNSTSDIALKNNVETVADALSVVNKLNGVEFEWKDTGKKSSGVVAQELEEVLPHLVETNDDGIKTVNYAGLSAYLIQAIKELTVKIDKL